MNKNFIFIIFLISIFLIQHKAYAGYFENGIDAVNVLGQTDNSGNIIYTKGHFNNSPDVTFNLPYSEAIDTIKHHLFISDASNNRILVFDLTNNNELIDLSADHVLGQANFTSNASGITQNTLSSPSGIAISSDYLYVADQYNNRIMIFNIAQITNGENAVNVIGQANFTSNYTNRKPQNEIDMPLPSQNTLAHPQSIAISSNNLYVTDSNNNRIMIFDISDVNNNFTNGKDAIC